MDLTEDTVVKEAMLEGYSAHDRHGEVIEGTCDYDTNTSDATVQNADLLSGKTAYAKGLKIVGTMPNIGSYKSDIKTKNEVKTIPKGYHDGSGTVRINEDSVKGLVPENVKFGVTILGVNGTIMDTDEESVYYEVENEAGGYTAFIGKYSEESNNGGTAFVIVG